MIQTLVCVLELRSAAFISEEAAWRSLPPPARSILPPTPQEEDLKGPVRGTEHDPRVTFLCRDYFLSTSLCTGKRADTDGRRRERKDESLVHAERSYFTSRLLTMFLPSILFAASLLLRSDTWWFGPNKLVPAHSRTFDMRTATQTFIVMI